MKKKRKSYPNTVPLKSQIGEHANMRLKRLRHKANMSQGQLAEFLAQSKIRCSSKRTVQDWECGRRKPQEIVYELLKKHCETLAV